MPEALARADHDYVLREDSRSAKSRRAPQKRPSRFAFLSFLTRRPGRTFLIGGGAVVLLGIGVNALFLQNTRHPAPFFRTQDQAANAAGTATTPLPPQRPAETARAPSRPATQTAALTPPATNAPSTNERTSAPAVEPRNAAAGAKPAPREAAQPTQAVRHDPIGALLRDGRPNAPTPPGSIPSASSEQTKRIVAVQEALKKLGHNVKPDGVAGPSTRVAIEAFERAQKLQVSGQMSPKLLRELASRSGVRIP